MLSSYWPSPAGRTPPYRPGSIRRWYRRKSCWRRWTAPLTPSRSRATSPVASCSRAPEPARPPRPPPPRGGPPDRRTPSHKGGRGGRGVRVASVIQKQPGEAPQTAELVIMTRPAREDAVQGTLLELRDLPEVVSVGNLLRVDG